ncbi:hypothetical protein P0136_10315 [Lentisphaerota bacterium ZTH]|nr:hypothetical protein JYG24_12175 [Lentisphaerota bacterium]WET05754.1 hypothetical protein P0136_10315 [Lentisphaerota bacterium ZTH]
MAWDGKRFDIPFIYLKHHSVEEAVNCNAFTPDDDVAAIIRRTMSSEELIKELAAVKMYKEACDFMAHCINPRVGVWWVYNCVKDLQLELEQANRQHQLTPEEKMQEEIKNKLKGWSDASALHKLREEEEAKAAAIAATMQKIAGNKIKDQDDPLQAVQQHFTLLNDSELAGPKTVIDQLENALAAFSPAEIAASRARLDKIYTNYEIENGINPLIQVKQIIEKELNPAPIPKDSGRIDQFYAGIKERIDEMESFINKTAAQHFPLKIPGLPKPKPSNSEDSPLAAVKRWILTPVNSNGILCRNAAHPKMHEPEGLCALSAYWSNSSLAPENEQAVHPPAGLAAKGLSNTLFRCCMDNGGSKAYSRRYHDYLQIGIDCITGILTWDKLWRTEKQSHAISSSCSEPVNSMEARHGFGRKSEASFPPRI